MSNKMEEKEKPYFVQRLGAFLIDFRVTAD